MIDLIVSGFAIMTAISVHEFGHAWVAYILGDPTAKYSGRMTINPMAHLDLIGLVFFVIAGFGWASPVPINESNFKNRKRDVILVSGAGAFFNILTAIVFAIVVKIAVNTGGIFSPVVTVCQPIIAYNIAFAAFNLFIPLPPLDGWRILDNIFNLYRFEFVRTMEQYSFLIFMLMYMTGILSKILLPIQKVLFSLVYLFM